ncbi:ATPase family aaa domain-containing protein 2b-like protein, partial [Chrysochromulina tobinii]
MDDGRRQTRRKSAVSYKEPNLHDIRRDPSPASNRLKRGDQIEVEVDVDGSGTTTWQSAEVVKLLGNDRFRAMVNGDAEFVEEYGPEDEGQEWRRASKYDGLKRQRKSVEHYQPGEVARGGPSRAGEELLPKASRSPAAAVLQGALDELTGARGGGGSGSGIGDAFAAAGGAKLADVQPLKVDGTVGWDQVGGLGAHVEALKEMVLIPLLYPEIFEQLGVTPPRGVLFHGPPGTGKTLVARALASTCSSAGRPVAFFMRKGADVLSKWVGEAEKQLRLLFEEATRLQPAIIFFDELDGLAPVRSSKQDYIHASIVSTLLALMDGLDSRGQVLLIGATNRIDALDSALRRPGRFDRELQFSLPSCAARREILEIHTRRWTPPLPAEQLDALARRTHGFCGADLKALCAEAALRALRGAFPEIFSSEDKYLLDASR